MIDDHTFEGPPTPEVYGLAVYSMIVDGNLSKAQALAEVLAEWYRCQIGLRGDDERTWLVIQAASLNGMAHAVRGVIHMQELQRERRKSRSYN